MGNLLSCFWTWVQGENTSNNIEIDPDQESFNYVSQIKDGLIGEQNFDELKDK